MSSDGENFKNISSSTGLNAGLSAVYPAKIIIAKIQENLYITLSGIMFTRVIKTLFGKLNFEGVMKTLFVLLFCITGLLYSQTIPYSHTIRVYHSDTSYIGKYYKVSYPYLNTKNFYIQIYGDYPFIYYGNIYRYLYGSSQVSDNMHNQKLKNYYWIGPYGIDLGYATDFAFSRKDTNMFIRTYVPADWEPYAFEDYSTDNGSNMSIIFQSTFMAAGGGVAIDPVNDSVMYCAYSYNGNPNYNIWKSTNKGANWFGISKIQGSIAYSKIRINLFDRNVIFIQQFTNNTLHLSTNGGYNFSFVVNNIIVPQIYFSDNNIFLCSSNLGLLKSTNNGQNWQTIFNTGTNDMEIDPLDSNIYYAGTAKGIYISTNKGLNWSIYNNSFLHTKNVIGLVKNQNSGDTIYTTTGKSVYKVFGRDVQDTANAQYIPLAVGNVYVYSWTEIPQTGKYKIKIIKDSVFSNGYRYFDITLPMTNFNWIRYDSISGNIMGFVSQGGCSYTPNEMPLDSLKSKHRDTLKICGNIFNKHICYDTSNISVFGYNKKRKSFGWNNITSGGRTFVKDFGLYSASVSEPPGYGRTDILVGCVINGVVYGDTTLTDINKIYGEIPVNFRLEQNYPNPFNPATKIIFAIPKRGFVNLKVYDVLGCVVKELVNEVKAEGIYSVDFNASELSSGIYFYKIEVNDFTDLKRMVFVK